MWITVWHTAKGRQCTYKCSIEGRSRNHYCREKSGVIYSKCVPVALVIQRAMHMRRFMLSCMTCLAVPHFLHCLVKGMVSGNYLLNIKCVSISSAKLVWNIYHSKKNWVRYQRYISLHVKYPLFLPDFNEFEFSRHIFEKYSDIKCYERPFSGSRVVPCGRTDWRQTEETEDNSRFSQFCERVLGGFDVTFAYWISRVDGILLVNHHAKYLQICSC